MGIVDCINITKDFGTVRALNNVSLSFDEGRICGMLGPNGSGKTTLIRIITKILSPSSGDILFRNRSITKEDVMKIGYMPEERGLYRKMPVGDQAMYLAGLKGMNRKDARRELKRWFEIFGAESWWDKKVEELSKGMAQKVQFITTVVHNPKLMILDEPFSGFDPVNAELIKKHILQLKENGSTIILSTHNMESVETLCDDIALINKSNLIVSGPVEKVRKQYGKGYFKVVLKGGDNTESCELFTVGNKTVMEQETRLDLHPADNITSNEILKYLMDNDCEIISFSEAVPSMNDIFIKLVTEGI